MILSGDERESDFQEEVLNVIDYVDSDYLRKNTYRNVQVQQVRLPGNESFSSNSSQEDDICPEGYQWINIEDYNMDYLDEPETDYSDDSDHEPIDWRDVVLYDNESVELGGESNHSDINDEEMSDEYSLSDISDQDEDIDDDDDDDDDDDAEDDGSPQVTIAIEVDNSDNSVEIMSSGGEEGNAEYDYGGYTDFEEPEEEIVNERVLNVIDYNDSEGIFDSSDSDFGDNNSNISRISTPSSRSRSPVAGPRVVERRSVSPIPPTPPVPIPNTTDSAVPQTSNTSEPPQPSSTIQTKAFKKDPNNKPSSSNLSTDSTEDSNDGMCCICLDNMSTHVVVPCGHICLCQLCKDLFESNDNHRRKKKCPLCKTPFTVIIKVYK